MMTVGGLLFAFDGKKLAALGWLWPDRKLSLGIGWVWHIPERRSVVRVAGSRVMRRVLREALCVVVVGAAVGVSGSMPRPDRVAVQLEVRRIAAREGVDPRLAEAVAETESAYDAWAVSRRGLWV